jgi:hypothetical protein
MSISARGVCCAADALGPPASSVAKRLLTWRDRVEHVVVVIGRIKSVVLVVARIALQIPRPTCLVCRVHDRAKVNGSMLQ